MTKEEKFALVREHKASGLSHAEFCKLKSISLKSFRQWKYSKTPRQAHASKTPSFIELVQRQDAVPIVVTAGRFRVEVPEYFDCGHLTRILEALPC
jgi:hypothetical protein